MPKKLIFIAITIVSVAIIGGSFFIKSKLDAREKRKQSYQNALNNKAEEISLKFLEGWNNQEIGDYLEKQNVIKQSDFLSALKDFDISNYSFVKKDPAEPLQGFLYPDTYRFFKNISDRNQTTPKQAAETIIKKFLGNFENKLPIGAEMQAKKQGLSLFEALTLASIVEKEAGNFPNEKATIAGIFYNRLKIGMALQSDATINYATKKSEAAPSLDDLEINSPYNTYKHKGLPPGPICNPSIQSIDAVLNPAQTEYLYYLHNQKTGQPYYAQTYEQHLINKQKYLK